MADKTMPPNDPTESSPAMPGEMGATASMGDAPMPQGGDVMISMPKSAFDAMQQIVQSLAQGLSQLAKDVDSQAKGGAQGGQGAMEASKEAAMPGGAASSEDEEFLKGLTEEGNSKTR
jgi:hypothetical protein